MACGALGHLEEVDEAFRRIDARADTGVAAFYWIRGLLLAGLLEQADQTARQYRERCQDTPRPADVITSFMCAHVAIFRGQIKTAVRWYRQAIAAIHGADPGG
ncbi:MAG: hypothetical protein JO287_06095 [Pseudonocardiales bacterium]|nr:hypothetical protein [Pseudonocardiales bacterium]